MAAGWATEETRGLVSLPLPITKAGLTPSHFAQCEDKAVVERSFYTLRCRWLLAGRQRKLGLLERASPEYEGWANTLALISMNITISNVDAV